MDTVHQLFMGFSVAMQPMNLFYGFLGCLIGTLVGVLPGLGPTAAMSLLLPATFHVTPVAAIIMLAGIFYGAMYGGSTTSILVNIPGEAASVVTCLDGYQMARQGKAGRALGISAFGSFIAGTLGIVGLTFLGPPLAKAALKFGPPEYFSLMVLGMIILTFLSSSSMIKALMMAAFGLLVGSVGTDTVSGTTRFSFGITELMDGVGLVPVVMGLFGISEMMLNIEQKIDRDIFKTRVKGLLPTFEDWMQAKWAILRGTVIGFFLGILPGGGAVLSSFVAYAVEKRCSKYPERFGTGMIEGVAAPESANNSAAQGSFIPLLTLGIPSNVVMAMLLGALVIHGVTPGPLLLRQHPEIFWGVTASMYIGNVMLLILNLPLIGLWVQVLKVPYPILMPLIILFCLIGAYTIANSVMDVLFMLVFGVIGYFMKKLRYDAPPFILAYVLGPMLEYSLKQSLIVSRGSFAIFVTRPIAATCLGVALLLLLLPLAPLLRGRRPGAKLESDIG
ncbi:MAG TPA: tripartite tricarboxylate transporter permease [Candidatus Sulfotelmatobacter sp.]|nr:tripartite tricarboxylate transporter permease [Candidatus Sulfotelmatobacter sp.]